MGEPRPQFEHKVSPAWALLLCSRRGCLTLDFSSFFLALAASFSALSSALDLNNDSTPSIPRKALLVLAILLMCRRYD
jgi:hypothetical protein